MGATASPTFAAPLAGFDEADLYRCEAEAGAAAMARSATLVGPVSGFDEADFDRWEAEAGAAEEAAARIPARAAAEWERRWAELEGFDPMDVEIARQEAEDSAAEDAAEREAGADPDEWFPFSFAALEMARRFPDWARAEHESERRFRTAEARRAVGRRIAPVRSLVPLDGRRRRGTSRARRRSSSVRGRPQRARAPDPDEPDDVRRGPARAGRLGVERRVA